MNILTDHLGEQRLAAAESRLRRHIAFADFDETYYPHRYDSDQQAAFEALELRLEDWTRAGQLIFGIVSGNSFEHIQNALKQRRHRYFPSFIAADFGACLFHYRGSAGYVEDLHWKSKVEAAAYDKNKALALGKALAMNGVAIKAANSSAQDRYRTSFYIKPNNRLKENDLSKLVHDLSTAHKLKANLTRCNPKAGDPAGWFDLDLIPLGTGKKETVAYLLDYYGMDTGQAIAFGDSCNDLEMLFSVKYGYLLSNAIDQAKRVFKTTTQLPYAEGIHEVLNKII